MARYWKTLSANRGNSLKPKWDYYVHVCSFTFRFSSLTQIERYRQHFSQKVHPSSADGAARSPFRFDAGHHAFTSVGDHWERQTGFDELPLYLFEEPKRQKVLKALAQALREFSK